MSRRYKLGERVIHENIQGEFVIVHLETGNYYSLQGTAATIWDYVASGMTESELLKRVSAQYLGDSQKISSSVAAFLSELEQESLISAADNGASGSSPTPADLVADQGKRPFEPPMLNRYTDMVEALKLDPIHHVDEELGWPTAKKGA
ncbi:MAG TPA: PqqD family protein [Candidatus Binataceae bacterium]|nr:PqqD family protein [Candidatus Binataceae bacterium]